MNVQTVRLFAVVTVFLIYNDFYMLRKENFDRTAGQGTFPSSRIGLLYLLIHCNVLHSIVNKPQNNNKGFPRIHLKFGKTHMCSHS